MKGGKEAGGWIGSSGGRGGRDGRWVREGSNSLKTPLFFTIATVKDAYDYLGRSYLHIPQDVDVDLKSDDPPDRCYAPKKQIHAW